MGKLRRKRSVREERFTVLILCQGERTEPDYFRRLIQKYRIPGVTVQSDPLDPANLVKKAIRLNVDRTFNAVFVVVDKDEFKPINLREANRRCKAASKPSSLKRGGGVEFRLVVSIPCFEAWLNTHNKPVRAPSTTRLMQQQAVENELVDPRKKKRLSENFPLDRWESAQDNVAEVDYGEFEPEAGTSVGRLVRYLVEVVNSQFDNRTKQLMISNNEKLKAS